MSTAESVPPHCEAPVTTAIAPVNLLFTADTLADLSRQAISSNDALDAFLLVVGLTQLVADRLHPDPLQLSRISDLLSDTDVPTARAAGALTRRMARLVRPFAMSGGARTLKATVDLLTEASIALGRSVIDPAVEVPPSLLAGIEPALSVACLLDPDVVRVPSSFRSFGQHPDDIAELTRRLIASDAPGPFCVVGIRTSGSYLAPLCAAALDVAGMPDVSVVTYRPGRPWRRSEMRTVRRIAEAGGTVLVLDDPPASGSAVVSTCDAVVGIGVPASAIVLLLALSGAEPPPALASWRGIYLPWDDWSAHQRMNDTAVADTMARLLGPGVGVVARRRQGRSRETQRRHLRGRYSVEMTDDSGVTRREIVVEGAGLGYFGRHALAIAAALPQHCPRVYGLDGGLLYRDWLPGAEAPPSGRELAETVTRYVVDRGRALQVDADPTARLRGRQPVWEVASRCVSTVFGRAWPVAETLLLNRITLSLLHSDTLSVPDGQTDVRHWVADGPAGPLRKTGFHQRSFSNAELVCYDAVFDLAGAAADPPTDDFERLLRESYQRRTGETIDHERWLLYRLAQLWRLGHVREMTGHKMADRSADAVHDYLAAVFENPPTPQGVGGGAICAIDLDGVLETDPLGFPCTTPAGAVTLRALIAHDFRPVLVTGRSLRDVTARCRRFGLAGAVAEYGAVLYDNRTGTHRDLRDDAATTAVRQVRRILRDRDGIELDDRHEFTVRARHRRGSLPPDVIAEVESLTGGSVRAVRGEGQTDFVPIGIDKGTGLRALTDLLGGRVALAVGDSGEDVPMFRRAVMARAPRNADDPVRAAGIRTTRGAYQAGLAHAAGELLGHPPGGCAQCRCPEQAPRTALLCAILGLREDGLRGLPARTARLFAFTAKARII